MITWRLKSQSHHMFLIMNCSMQNPYSFRFKFYLTSPLFINFWNNAKLKPHKNENDGRENKPLAHIMNNSIYIFTDRSPIYSHLSSTLEGIHVIRAFRAEDRFLSSFYGYQDDQTSAQFLYLSATRWLALRLDWVVSLYFSGCILAAFLIPDSCKSD